MQPGGCYDPSNPHAALWARRISYVKVEAMAWTSPVFEEVVLCCEINSYVSAKL